MREEEKVLHHAGMKNWIGGGPTGMDAVSMAIATHSSDAAASEIIKEMCGLVQQPSFTPPPILSFLSGVLSSPPVVGGSIRPNVSGI